MLWREGEWGSMREGQNTCVCVCVCVRRVDGSVKMRGEELARVEGFKCLCSTVRADGECSAGGGCRRSGVGGEVCRG